MTGFTDGRHAGADTEEWVFTAWTADASLGLVSGHRIAGRTAWYWAALARAGRPLLHVLDHGITVRRDPFVVKGEALWAEHSRDAPMEQWSLGNETFASALDDPGDALGRAYGDRTPIAFDLEWAATAPPVGLTCDPGVIGYVQEGTVYGAIEVFGEPTVELSAIPARRWHRWTEPSDDAAAGAADDRTGRSGRPPATGPPEEPVLGPVEMPEAVAHAGVRAPFAFPDGTSVDLVLTPDGWRRRSVRPR